jgi:hypothetical protein
MDALEHWVNLFSCNSLAIRAMCGSEAAAMRIDLEFLIIKTLSTSRVP